MSKPDREAMLDRDCIDLSMRRQCTLLRLARSGVYRRKAEAIAEGVENFNQPKERLMAVRRS